MRSLSSYISVAQQEHKEFLSLVIAKVYARRFGEGYLAKLGILAWDKLSFR